MTFEQIKILHDMGFTPDQITLLTTSGDAIPPDQAAAAQPVDANPSATGAAAIIDEPAKEDSPSDAVDKPVETVDNSDKIIDALNDLKKTLQASNIKTQSMETVNPDNNLENIRAEFIRPNFDKKEGA